MADAVRDAYDARAEEYAALALGDLDRVPGDREWLAAFARLVRPGAGAVADLGCGPGHVVGHLSELGISAIGWDVSPAMVEAARRAFPASEFRVGDLAALAVADGSLAGIVSRYSLIHLSPGRLGGVFREWARALEPGAPVLVSFFAADSARSHGRPFDHAVVTAHALHPSTVADALRATGFEGLRASTRRARADERPLDHGTVLARRGGA